MTSASDATVAAPPQQQDRADAAQPGRLPTSRRSFRSDIEGLRAIAVGLVIAYHAFGEPFSAGFVGVDVFFVVSGFLITDLLLREQHQASRISIAKFYARRARRILPAATLVVLVTLFATYHWLGFITGNSVSTDAKWTALFAANIHFGLVQTDYLGAQSHPSPLQHMWSLGVEEQFYLIWPGLFLAVIVVGRSMHHRAKLATILTVIITASLIWSHVQTSTNQTWAYFSPLTRAWELALGALVAVAGPAIARLVPARAAQVLALAGLTGIILSAVLFTLDTPYPGLAAVLPVTASAALIAAGCVTQRTVVGRILSVRPMQWAGARSYSMYLWHWPLLIIPAQYAGRDLGVLENVGWVVLGIVASALTYRFVENPVRRARFLTSHTGWSLALGLLLTVTTIAISQSLIAAHYGTWSLFG